MRFGTPPYSVVYVPTIWRIPIRFASAVVLAGGVLLMNARALRFVGESAARITEVAVATTFRLCPLRLETRWIDPGTGSKPAFRGGREIERLRRPKKASAP